MRQERVGQNFWLVSVPREENDETGERVIDEMKSRLEERGLCESINKFEVPNFRIGTYDSLMTLSDDLKKVDTYVEGQLKRIAGYYWKVTDKKDDVVIHFDHVRPDDYLKAFIWDSAHYSVRKQLSEITENIQAEVGKIEEDLRIKVSAFTSVEAILNKVHKDETGSLLTRDLTNVLKTNEPIEKDMESEYLVTLYVVVPRGDVKVWEREYETFTEYVMPRSAEVIEDDSDFFLYSVVTFKQFVDDFKLKAREYKFTVRKHEPNSTMDQEKRDELTKTLDKRKKDLNRFCKANYGEVFKAWVHLKAIRVYVESVLRFGLPARFRAVVIEPPKKSIKKLRKALDVMYKDLLGQEERDQTELDTKAISVLGGVDEFYAYVYLEIFIEHEQHDK